MRHSWTIATITIALALVGSSGLAAAQPASHHWQGRHHSSRAATTRSRRHRYVVGNRRTRVYRVLAYRSGWLPTQDRIYFRTAAEARAAGYRQGGNGPIPVAPSLTWHGTRQELPSLGKHQAAPKTPKSIQKPLMPPKAKQPLVTPTQPMPF